MPRRSWLRPHLLPAVLRSRRRLAFAAERQIVSRTLFMDPNALVADLERVLPGFADYVASADNLFDSDNLSGVFAACSHFVTERVIAADSWPSLAAVINRVVSESDAGASNAACTCFLENLADPHHPLRPFLEGEALSYWKDYEGAG